MTCKISKYALTRYNSCICLTTKMEIQYLELLNQLEPFQRDILPFCVERVILDELLNRHQGIQDFSIVAAFDECHVKSWCATCSIRLTRFLAEYQSYRKKCLSSTVLDLDGDTVKSYNGYKYAGMM
jgi:hypothetical protein